MASQVGFRISESSLLPWSQRKTVSASAVARMLDVAVSTVCAMIQKGELRAYKVRPALPNSHWRVEYDSVIEHLEMVHREQGLARRF